jgi:hypothetical protein
MFRGLRAAKRLAPAATRPFDQWCEIKSFTPLQLIAIASRPASPTAKNSERVSSTYRLGADESWSRVVSFSILLRTAAAQKQQLSRVLRTKSTRLLSKDASKVFSPTRYFFSCSKSTIGTYAASLFSLVWFCSLNKRGYGAVESMILMKLEPKYNICLIICGHFRVLNSACQIPFS